MKNLLLSGMIVVMTIGLWPSPGAALQPVIVEDLAADEEGNPTAAPPEIELTKDGFLVLDGDVFLDCVQAVQVAEQYAQESPAGAAAASEVEEVIGVAQRCRAAGFDTSAYETATATRLPDTGGVSPQIVGLGICLLAAGLLLVSRKLAV